MINLIRNFIADQTTLSDRYQLGYRSEDASTELHHLDGVKWTDAPKPRHWHRCSAQTVGYINYFTLVQRCPCGAIKLDDSRWMNKNSH